MLWRLFPYTIVECHLRMYFWYHIARRISFVSGMKQSHSPALLGYPFSEDWTLQHNITYDYIKLFYSQSTSARLILQILWFRSDCFETDGYVIWDHVYCYCSRYSHSNPAIFLLSSDPLNIIYIWTLTLTRGFIRDLFWLSSMFSRRLQSWNFTPVRLWTFLNYPSKKTVTNTTIPWPMWRVK